MNEAMEFLKRFATIYVIMWVGAAIAVGVATWWYDRRSYRRR